MEAPELLDPGIPNRGFLPHPATRRRYLGSHRGSFEGFVRDCIGCDVVLECV